MSISLIVLDVDGTMTNGKITYSEKGDEIKSFNVKDGLAINSWLKLGKQVAIITGRSSHIVKRRSEELGISYLFQGIHNKQSVLEELLEKLSLNMENVASIGDDLNDLTMLKSSKMSFCPKDASKHIQNITDVTLGKNGGDGAVREMIEILIKKEDLEKAYLKLWS